MSTNLPAQNNDLEILDSIPIKILAIDIIFALPYGNDFGCQTTQGNTYLCNNLTCPGSFSNWSQCGFLS